MSRDVTSHIFSQLSLFDGVIFFAIIGCTVISILVGHNWKKRTPEPLTPKTRLIEHLLMGRQLTLPLFVATLVASWYGGIFGVSEIAFNSGIYNFVTQGLFWYMTYIIFALFIVGKIKHHNAVTLPDLVDKLFGPRAAKVAAVFNFFNVLPVAYVLSLGIFLQMLFGLPLWLACALGAGCVCVYSTIGGMRADVFSDLVQFVVMCASVLLVIVFARWEYGGLDFLTAQLPASYFSPLGESTVLQTLLWGFIALATLVDPCFYQRCFAVEKSFTATVGILICTCIWCVFDLCTTFGAMYAKAVLPTAHPNEGYLLFALQVLPAGLRGFFLAGIVAIIISTLDSFLIIAAQTVSYDLLPKAWRFKSMAVHRFSTVLVAILCVVIAQNFDGKIRNVWKIFGSYSAGCLLLPMLTAYFRPKRVSESTFIFSTISSAIVITLWFVMPREGILGEIDALYAGLLCSALVLVKTWWEKEKIR